MGLIKIITCFYLKLTLLYIGIMPDEDLWVETLLLMNSFGAAIFSVRTSLLFHHNNKSSHKSDFSHTSHELTILRNDIINAQF